MRALATIPQRRFAAAHAHHATPPARRACMELSSEAIEAIASRVAELLARERTVPATTHLVDAATVAARFGLSRAWVYQHAEELGAIALGGGPRPRLRFDLATVDAALQRRRDRAPTSQLATPPLRTRARKAPDAGSGLLPIRGQAAGRGVRAIFFGRVWDR